MRDTRWLRTALASALICASGGALLWRATDGFRSFTSEQARRQAIARAPRMLPLVALEDQDGNAFTLMDYIGQPVAVDFIYTQCRTVCPMLSASFQRLARAERAHGPRQRIPLLSISFDPGDSRETLRAYATRYQADGRDWRFARVRDTAQLWSLLRSFGIVVIPDGRGDFQHNAAIHVLDRHGRLARVLDPDATAADVARAAWPAGRRSTTVAMR